jgi:hypothetical protein
MPIGPAEILPNIALGGSTLSLPWLNGKLQMHLYRTLLKRRRKFKMAAWPLAKGELNGRL